MSKPFFQSVKHPHLWMNKYGLVFAPQGHPDGVDYWLGVESVPLRRGLLDLMYSVQDEARAVGYAMRYIGNGDVLFSKS